MCVPNNNLWPARYQLTLSRVFGAKLNQLGSNAPRWMNTIIGRPTCAKFDRDSISLEQPQWTAPTCRSRRRRRRRRRTPHAFVLLVFSCPAALLDPQSVFQREGLPAQEARAPDCQAAMLPGRIRKHQARLLANYLLTGHIRDLTCSLVITIRAGDIAPA